MNKTKKIMMIRYVKKYIAGGWCKNDYKIQIPIDLTIFGKIGEMKEILNLHNANFIVQSNNRK